MKKAIAFGIAICACSMLCEKSQATPFVYTCKDGPMAGPFILAGGEGAAVMIVDGLSPTTMTTRVSAASLALTAKTQGWSIDFLLLSQKQEGENRIRYSWSQDYGTQPAKRGEGTCKEGIWGFP
jgi:hypothetical protein